MATPPFNIAETTPGDSDIVSQFPTAERTYRDVVEDWITTEHDTYGHHKLPSLTTTERDADTNWSVGSLIYNETVKQLQFALTADPDTWYSEGVPTATRAPFQQTSAPTGWTKESGASYEDAVMVATTGSVATAGSVAASTLFARTGTDAVTLSAANIPTLTSGNFAWAGTAAAHTHTGTTSTDGAHSHTYIAADSDTNRGQEAQDASDDNFGSKTTSTNGAHTHTFTTNSSGPHTVTMSSMSYTNGSLSSFTPAIDLRVKRFSCIIATKN